MYAAEETAVCMPEAEVDVETNEVGPDTNVAVVDAFVLVPEELETEADETALVDDGAWLADTPAVYAVAVDEYNVDDGTYG